MSFDDARVVFARPMLVDPDDRFDNGEQRWIGIGRLNAALRLYVETHRAA